MQIIKFDYFCNFKRELLISNRLRLILSLISERTANLMIVKVLNLVK